MERQITVETWCINLISWRIGLGTWRGTRPFRSADMSEARMVDFKDDINFTLLICKKRSSTNR